MHPLISEAMKKAAVGWIGVGGQPPYAVWCLWVDDALYVVSGPGEQPAPGLARASAVAVTARGDNGGRIVTWQASTERVRPDTELWQAIVPQLAGKRLNSAGTENLAERWARECVVSRLVPTGEVMEAGPTLPDGSLAAPPPQSPAVRATRKPFRLHRVRLPPPPR